MSNEEQSTNAPENALEEDQVTLDSQNVNEIEPEAAADGDLAAKIGQLEDELISAKEQALRAAAEAQNARRRAEQDVEKAHKFALDKFTADLLPVVDNLERALEAGNADGAEIVSLNEGVELTLKALVSSLIKHKIEALNPAGEPFDPQFHQAITMISNPDCEPNTVMDVIQKGYTLNGRLVRPAMVVVSKA
ncbi:MAG: molecular chaperone GrpE [Flavobacteriales bacterium]